MTHDLTAAIRCHCLGARRRARAITRHYEEKLRPHGLRATQFSILAALALKGATPIRELADLLGLERTSLTRSAGVMERNGWLATAESDDARARPLELTAEGRRKLDEAFPAWSEAQAEVDRGDWQEPVFAPRAGGPGRPAGAGADAGAGAGPRPSGDAPSRTADGRDEG